MTTWNEGMIARAISLQTLARKCVVLVDRCNWTGHECDVLGVTTDLRIIDVEIKISRADLKADARKEKWWRHLTYAEKVEAGIDSASRDWWGAKNPTDWPLRVWKHYYALPKEIWKQELLECLPSPASGVLLLTDRGGLIEVSCARRATPNRDADRLRPEQVMDIARLANLRMWEAYKRVEDARGDSEFWRQRAKDAA